MRIGLKTGVILLLLTLAAWAVAQEQPAKKGVPKIEFKEVVHDFGVLKPDAQVTCKFEFKNTGDAELEIINVRSTCGCTAAMPDKKKLAPGESSAIQVRYQSGKGSGTVEKKINIQSNDPAEPYITLTIKAKVVTDLDLKPAYLRFDNIDPDKPAELEVVLVTKDPENFTVSNLVSDTPFIVPAFVREPDNILKVVVQFKPELMKSSQKGYVNAFVSAATNSETYPEIKIPVYIKFFEEYTLIPPRIMIYGLKEGEGASREIIVKNNKGNPFTIATAVSSNQNIQVEIVKNGEAANLLKVTVAKDAPAGLCNSVVSVQTPRQELKIPVRARVGEILPPPGSGQP